VTTRIAAAALGLIVLLLAGVVVPLGLITASRDRQLLADRTTAAASAVAAATEEHLTDRSILALGAPALPPPATSSDVVTVFDDSGQRLAATESEPVSHHQQVTQALAGRTTVRWTSHPDDTLLVAVPVRSGPRVIGAITLARNTNSLANQIRRLWLGLGLAAALAVVLAALLAWTLARWVGQPLRHLEATAAEVGGGALQSRADEQKGPPELRVLAATFNEMASRLETLLDGHRAFVADVSHQLRTPLATMRLRLELLREDVDATVGGELSEALAETQRLSRMLDGLLAVARAENSQSMAGPVDAAKILTERAAAWRPVAAEVGVDLNVHGPASLGALATPDHLDQVLDNLIANALDVVPAGGEINLSAAARSGAVRIIVADTGPGMSEQQRAGAFRRFWTHRDQDPVDRTQRRNTGLGLAIVHRLVTADGGDIHLAEAEGGGLAALIDLPSAMLASGHEVARRRKS
jgi:signal transduction histidine kinase